MKSKSVVILLALALVMGLAGSAWGGSDSLALTIDSTTPASTTRGSGTERNLNITEDVSGGATITLKIIVELRLQALVVRNTPSKPCI